MKFCLFCQLALTEVPLMLQLEWPQGRVSDRKNGPTRKVFFKDLWRTDPPKAAKAKSLEAYLDNVSYRASKLRPLILNISLPFF